MPGWGGWGDAKTNSPDKHVDTVTEGFRTRVRFPPPPLPPVPVTLWQQRSYRDTLSCIDASGHPSGTPNQANETYYKTLTTIQLRLYVLLHPRYRGGVAHEFLCLLGTGAAAVEQGAANRLGADCSDHRCKSTCSRIVFTWSLASYQQDSNRLNFLVADVGSPQCCRLVTGRHGPGSCAGPFSCETGRSHLPCWHEFKGINEFSVTSVQF